VAVGFGGEIQRSYYIIITFIGGAVIYCWSILKEKIALQLEFAERYLSLENSSVL